MSRTRRILLGLLIAFVLIMLALRPAIKDAVERQNELSSSSPTLPACATLARDASGQYPTFCLN